VNSGNHEFTIQVIHKGLICIINYKARDTAMI